MWRDIFRPLYERLTSRAHQYGMKVIQHSCGYNWELVDDLCEAGIDCLPFDQPAIYDMELLADKVRAHGVGLFSPCDIQLVLPTGDRALTEGETRRLVEPEWNRWAYDTFVEVGCEQTAAGCGLAAAN